MTNETGRVQNTRKYERGILRQTRSMPFVQCPHCRKLLEMDCAICPECREPISEEYARLSAITNVINTAACNLAKDIRDRDRIMAPILLLLSIALYLIDMRAWGSLFSFWFTVLLTAGQLCGIVVWHLRFRRFAPLGDSDYIQATAYVRRSAALWLTILVLQVLVIVGTRP
jgi:hypothetical protein